MKAIKTYQDKQVLVIGFGISGVNAAKLLVKLGAKVTINDLKESDDQTTINELKALGIRIIMGANPLSLADEGFDLVVKNPGIPYTVPLIAKFVTQGTPIITELELGAQIFEGQIVAVTGSNGKTTTTTLIQQMLAKGSQHQVVAAGHIGVSVSQQAQVLTSEDTMVMETSSFQLLGAPTFHPHIAVITNIFASHLNYHGNRQNYINAKLNITRNQTKDDFLVINWDQEEWQELSRRTEARVIPFSRENKSQAGAYQHHDQLFWQGEVVMSVADVSLVGPQNIENALAAIAVAKLSGVSNEAIREVLSSFSGVRHRLQYVMTAQGRKIYNDSKATDIEACEVALQGFNQPVILIAGGLDRGDDFSRLATVFKDHVKALITVGETKERLSKAGKQAGVPVVKESQDVITAAPMAWQLSEPGDVILLSPACASWDQFPSFEVRGDRFIETIEAITGQKEEV